MTSTKPADGAQATTPFWCICKSCSHTWIAAYLPMEVTKFVRIAKGHSCCPKCGGVGLVAKQKDGVLNEPVEAWAL